MTYQQIIQSDRRLQEERRQLLLKAQALVGTTIVLGHSTPYPGRKAVIRDVSYEGEVKVKVKVYRSDRQGFLDDWNPFVRCFRPLREVTQSVNIDDPVESKLYLMALVGS